MIPPHFDSLTTNLRLSKYVKFREEKFGGVLFETRAEKVFTLNAIAAAVIGEINKGGDQEEIVRRLQQRFQGHDETIERDALAFIADLRQKGLIQE